MIRLSIIIPVFNLEGYISACLDSIYEQEVDETLYEIIIVDDGSSDNSGKIIEKYNEHNNLRVVKKNNEGVSKARNVGIKESIGDYLIFVDGDDTLNYGCLDELLSAIKEPADIYVMKSVNAGREVYSWENLFANKGRYDSLHVFRNGYFRGSVCGCAFNRKFVSSNNIGFVDSLKYGEDSLFFLQCMSMDCIMQFENIFFYNVTTRQNSATRTRNVDYKNYLYAIEFLKNARAKHYFCYNEILDFTIYIYCSNIINRLIEAGYCVSEILKILSLKELLPIGWRNMPFGITKMALFNFSPLLFCYSVKLKQFVKSNLCRCF